MRYFFDSYAIVEIIQSNPNYASYAEEPVVTTKANLAEVYFFALRTGQTEAYRTALNRMRPELLEATQSDWENAADFRYAMRGKRVSLIDGLGYRLAQKHGLKFLTGDKEIEKLADVQFVK